MRVISINVNGIRSAASKGLFSWLSKQNADVICLQEVRASEDQLTDPVYHPAGYYAYLSAAEKKGYSGVAIYCKQKPDEIKHGLGWHYADLEGRYLEARFGDLCVASLYLPSGTSGDERQAVKYHFLDEYTEILKQQIKSNKQYIICGDWNIAHTPIDLVNWKANQKYSGFLPAERAWLDKLFGEIGWVDSFRYFNPDKVEYTWWSNRSKTAWANNVGWRIDYQIITPGLAEKITATAVYRDEKFSDHAPVIVDYAI